MRCRREERLRRALIAPKLALLLTSIGGLAGRARAESKDPMPVATSVTPRAASGSASSPPPPALAISMPRLADTREHFARTEHSDWFTGYAPARTPVVRIAPGAAFRLEGEGKNAFALDVVVGARLGLTPGARQWGVFPELGYGWNKANHEHQLTLGVGLGKGELSNWGYAAIMPRLVLEPGAGAGRRLGGRLGAVVQMTETGLSLEAAVQRMLPSGEGRRMDLRFSLGIDLFLLGAVTSGIREWKMLAQP